MQEAFDHWAQRRGGAVSPERFWCIKGSRVASSGLSPEPIVRRAMQIRVIALALLPSPHLSTMPISTAVVLASAVQLLPGIR